MLEIIKFFLVKWAWVGFVAASVVIAGFYVKFEHLVSQNQVLESRNTALKLSLDVSEQNVTLLSSKLEQQNKAIEQIKNFADENLKKSEAKIKQANNIANEYKNKSAAILNKTPAPGEDLCKAADNLFKEDINDKL